MQDRPMLTTKDLAELLGISRSQALRRSQNEAWKFELAEGPRKTTMKIFALENLPPDVQQKYLETQKAPTAPTTEVPAAAKPACEATPEPESPSFIQKLRRPATQDTEALPLGLRTKEITIAINALEKRGVIFLGKFGIGKSHCLEILCKHLGSQNAEVIRYTEPPTARGLQTNLALRLNIAPGKNKDEFNSQLSALSPANTIYVAIDKIENMTPSVIEAVGVLMEYPWFRFIGAGHLGRKKKYNNVWMKCKGIMLKPLARSESLAMVHTILAAAPDQPENKEFHIDDDLRQLIVNEGRGIPQVIVNLLSDARKGLRIEEKERHLDFTIAIIVISVVGMCMSAIGRGYSSLETTIVGGTIFAFSWGTFWIYRGYHAGWWGHKKEAKQST